jgi:hypothetical protein
MAASSLSRSVIDCGFFSSVCPDSIDRANGQAAISPAPEGGESEEVHWDTQNNIICIRAEGGRKGGPGQEREKSHEAKT